ncbi:MAG TPA: BREX system ATP-binding protein BrxD [Kofleriaceae bacterium]|nr:BREX system ATP-binding protein BrxD [Kofleriaceae bacterium]
MTVVPESREIVAALRRGLVPARGLSLFATGLEPLAKAVMEELALVAQGGGNSKWIRGEYGAGKTFAARYLCMEARAKGFATSEVQISINDTPLHHLETVYRRLVEKLETAADGRNAFQAIVDAWLYQVGEEIQRLKGITEDDPSFADATEERLEDKLADLSRRNNTFAQVLRAYHRAMHEGDYGTAHGLIAWLSGQPHIDRSVTSKAGVSGKVDGQAAMAFLAGLLQLLRQSGYPGLVVVLDEVETIQRMNAQTRVKALIALRQFMDAMANGELPGLYLVVTGTRDFFEGYKGLKTEPALHQRVNVKFDDDPEFDNLRAAQVRLMPFDADRLFAVGQRVRDLFPSEQPSRIQEKVNDTFLRSLVDQVTAGFGGKVAIAPRLFLIELTDILDRVDQHQSFDPATRYKLKIEEADLTLEELAALRGEVAPADEEVEEAPQPTKGPRRLDG